MKRLIGALMLVFVLGLPAAAQEADQQPAAVPELTELERAQLQGLVKDFTIAAKDVELAQARSEAAQHARALARQVFLARVQELRKLHNAPEAEYDFDVTAMKFVPKKQPEEEKAEPSTGSG